MKTNLLVMSAFLCLFSGAAISQDGEDLSATINEFKNIPAVAPFFASAYGYAVWPRIARGGLGVGGATGRGQVYVNGKLTGFSRVSDITFGAQAGGQAYKQIIFFEDERAYKEFIGGKFEFDASASAVAVTASAQASAGTQGSQAAAGAGSASSTAAVVPPSYRKGLQVFTMAIGGLMYQATIGGQKYNFKAVDE
jgi:lipid-binding SYLF domain-containing protein